MQVTQDNQHKQRSPNTVLCKKEVEAAEGAALLRVSS